MKLFTVFLLLFFFCTHAFAQNGKLISKEPYIFSDSTIVKLEKRLPGFKQINATVEFSKITYLSDGLKIGGYMAAPKKEGKYPCIIFNRGGNRDFGMLNDMNIGLFLGEEASWGYIVIGSQYRGNNESEGKEEFGGSDVNDVLNVIPLFTNFPKADTSRIGMSGWSRGGMMTYLALTKTNGIRAAVVGSGVTDAFAMIKARPEMEKVYSELVPNYYKNKETALKERSAVYWAEKMCMATPMLILQGSADWRVPPEQSLNLLNKLNACKHPVRYSLFEGGQHSLSEHWPEVSHQTRIFLDKYVRDLEKWPSLEPHGN